jgi:hypothetical protein
MMKKSYYSGRLTTTSGCPLPSPATKICSRSMRCATQAADSWHRDSGLSSSAKAVLTVTQAVVSHFNRRDVTRSTALIWPRGAPLSRWAVGSADPRRPLNCQLSPYPPDHIEMCHGSRPLRRAICLPARRRKLHQDLSLSLTFFWLASAWRWPSARWHRSLRPPISLTEPQSTQHERATGGTSALGERLKGSQRAYQVRSTPMTGRKVSQPAFFSLGPRD